MKTIPILILVIALQGTKNHAADAGKRDLYDDAEAALLQYSLTVDTIVAEATQAVEAIWSDVLHTAVAIRSLATRVLLHIQRSWLTELEALEKAAQQQGGDVSSCVTPARSHIYNLPLDYIYRIEECIDERIGVSEPLIEETFANLNNIREGVNDFQRRINECRAADDAACTIIVLTQIEAQNALLPIILDNDVQEIRGQLSDAELYYQDCTVAPTDTFTTQGHNIVEAAKLCVQIQQY